MTKMPKDEAFAKFGSYLQVQVGRYDAIYETLGSYDEARKSNSVDDNGKVTVEAYDWYFPNTPEGLLAAMAYAYERRVENRMGPSRPGRYVSAPTREDYRQRPAVRIQVAWAKLVPSKRNKVYLDSVAKYDAETARIREEDYNDDLQNVGVIRMNDELELGTVPEIGDTIYQVVQMQEGVDVQIFVVDGYSIYSVHDGSAVDAVIHANFGHGKGSWSNDGDRSYSNSILFLDRTEAYAQAKVWAQKLVDANKKWL